MTKFRFSPIFLIFLFWFSTTGFLPYSQNVTTIPLTIVPSNADPAMAVTYTFNPISPANGSTNQWATVLTLEWEKLHDSLGNPYPGTVTYRYCLLTKNKSRSCKWKTIASPETPTVTATISNLSLGKTYYWWVRAYDSKNIALASANGGTSWSFKTTSTKPGVFNKTSPTSGAKDLEAADPITIRWGASTNASYYEYCVDTMNNNVCDGTWQKVSSGTSTGLTGLSYNTTYYWQVRAVNGAGTVLADAGTWWSFSTLVKAGIFNKSGPENNATGQLVNNLVLSWSVSSSATSYRYCVSVVNNTCSGGWQNAGTATTVTLTGLPYNTVYYWQAQAVAGAVTTDADSGVWWKFTTQIAPPDAFNKLAPTNATAGVYTDVTFTWQPSVWASGYEICIVLGITDDSCASSITGQWEFVDGTSYTMPGLDPSVTYYWQVRAINDTGTTYSNGDLSTWWSLTTQSVPLADFYKTVPAGETPKADTSLVMQWTTSDPGVTYAVCYDSTNDAACDQENWHDAAAGSTSYQVTGLSFNTTYYWQVRATKNGSTAFADGDLTFWWSFTTKLAPPTSFSKTSPQESAIQQPLNGLVLSWEPSAGATSYRYCVSTTNSTCDSPNGWQNAGSAATATVSGLSNSHDYYWQVQAVNADATSDANGGVWWKFTTAKPMPADFDKLTPVDAAQKLYTDVTFTWQPSTWADSYEFCVFTSIDSTCNGGKWVSVNGTSHTAVGLNLSTTYYWQVRAVNATGATASNNVTWWSFTTQTNPPAAFTKIAPVNALTKTDTAITLQWSASDADVSYVVCYDTTNDGDCDQSNWQAVNTGTSFNLSGLSLGATYYWQVRATNAGGISYADGSMLAWWSFTTKLAPPSAFTKSTPKDGAGVQPIDLLLQWDPSSQGVSYEVCYDQTPDSICDQNNWYPVSSGTAYDLSGLSYGATYYWQVRAINAEGVTTEADNGTWQSFTTMQQPPQAFTKSSPTDERNSEPVNLTLQWAASNGAVTYEYCVSLTSGSCDPQPGWHSSASTSAALSNLAYDTQYYWQVRAKNSEGTITEANAGAWWNFTTYSQPPSGFVKISPTDSASDQPDNVTLSWSDAGAGFTYEYCVAQTSPLSCATWTTASATSVQLSGLANNTTYYWQVRAKDHSAHTTDANSLDTDPIWQFTTTAVTTNETPILDPITVPATVTSQQLVSFTVTATDADQGTKGETLTYSIDTLPAGANFNQTTGEFRWTPTWIKGGNNVYSFKVTVSDGSASDSQDITITVVPQMVYLSIINR
jgi:hypothetical protein